MSLLSPTQGFFKPNEIADFLGIKPHIVCYWEAEFPEIKPLKNKEGHKLYKREDAELLCVIKNLVIEKKHTIAAAKKILKETQNISCFLDESKEHKKIDDGEYIKIKEILEGCKENLFLVLQSLNRFEAPSEWQAWNNLF